MIGPPTIANDAARYPRLFRWRGPISRDVVDTWIAETGRIVPSGLSELWGDFGVGDIFESEELFGPITFEGCSIDSETRRWRDRGMADGLVVFHTGVVVSTFRQNSGDMVILSTALLEVGRPQGVDKWYRRWIRREYADHYGLGRSDG